MFYANYGVTDRLDVGAAIPVVHVKFGGSVTSTIERTATAGQPAIHSFDGQGQVSQTLSETASATGLGDILLRGKYSFVRSNANALAASIDLSLPTGDKDNLLGTGATQTKLQLLASGEYGLFAPHAYFGYTFSNGDVSDLTADVLITVRTTRQQRRRRRRSAGNSVRSERAGRGQLWLRRECSRPSPRDARIRFCRPDDS